MNVLGVSTGVRISWEEMRLGDLQEVGIATRMNRLARSIFAP